MDRSLEPTTPVLAAALGVLILCSHTSCSASPVAIGTRKQLFIDDRIIGSLGGATRAFQQAQKAGPYLSASTAWENARSLAYPTVLREGPDTWKMWYRAGTPAGEQAICYATSTDGVNWTKPNLGLYPHNGGKNNIVMLTVRPNHVDVPSVFREDDGYYYMYAIEADRRYLSFRSADGIRGWTKCPNGLHADHSRVTASGTYAPRSANYDISQAYYDRFRGDYIFHFKVPHDQELFGADDWQRKFHQHRYTGSLSNLASTPFPRVEPRHELADAVDEALEPGTLRAENYGMAMYPQEDGSVVGFSWLLSIDGHAHDGFWHYGHMSVQLVFTRDIDGAWQRPTRAPIIPRGSTSGDWDWGMVSTANMPVEVPQAETFGAPTDEVWLYVTGANHKHNLDPPTGARNHQFGIAKWRMDGFASLRSDASEDVITTKALTFSGDRLTLNADASTRGAQIQVEIVGGNGTQLKPKSDAVTGNSLSHTVTWRGDHDLSGLAGTPVVLKLYSTNADLYALEFHGDRGE